MAFTAAVFFEDGLNGWENSHDRRKTNRKIISAFYTVYNTLGYGFIGRIYHNAMVIEMAGSGLSAEIEKPIAV